MREASRTALATAYLRAAHQILDSKPCLLDDPVAMQLLGSGAERRIREGAERYRTRDALALRSHLVLRSRYAEDRLSAAVQRGACQYVIIGAGFDTFALRQPQWASSLKVIEVDHLASQTAKQARMAEAGLNIPENLFFADVDFENEGLLDGLLRNGVEVTEPTFFSWLGVTMYLGESAVDTMIESMAGFPEGSEVALTFLQPASDVPPAFPARPSRLAQLVAESGEPFVSYFDPATFETKLLAAGFTRVEFLAPEIAVSRYYPESQTNLPPPRRTSIASAIR